MSGQIVSTEIPPAPRRVQRKRTKGWRMPPHTVYVGRPTRWGNGHRIGEKYLFVDELWAKPPDRGDRLLTSNRDLAAAFRQDVGLLEPHELVEWIAPLRGRDLACWCPLDQPCHADVLLELLS